MAEFNEREKKLLLESAESQAKIHTFLMGLNGEPGFCQRIEDRVGSVEEKLDNVNYRHNKLNNRVWWLIGILSGSGVITASAIGINKIIGG